MNRAFLEHLLWQSESDSLDFKSKQYPFQAADDETKSELLKDILALANSHRLSDAYLLIGVQEIEGDRSVPVGVDVHLKDSDLQQFVNYKTDRTLVFKYEPVECDGVQIGIVSIPLQDRPIRLKGDFGKLRAGAVYIRRGSSTATATDEEVEAMRGPPLSPTAGPELSIEWGRMLDRIRHGRQLAVTCTHLPFGDDLVRRLEQSLLGKSPVAGFGINWSYPRELAEYTAWTHMHVPLSITIENVSSRTATHVVARASVPFDRRYKFVDAAERPALPERNVLMSAGSIVSALRPSLTRVERYGDRSQIQTEFDRVRPHDREWSNAPVYVTAQEHSEVEVTFQIFADSLPLPLEIPLGISFEVQEREMTPEDIAAVLREEGVD